MIPRLVEPELLDSLPANDPRAIRSRRDLRVINSWMGNARHLARAIARLEQPPQSILELGTGDGTLMLKLARRLTRPVDLWLLDMQPVVDRETLALFRSRGWNVQVVAARLQEWLKSSLGTRFDLVIANLFLHHFSD